MLDSRDINLLRPDMKLACLEVISRAKAQGINIIITSTVRDDEFQNKLYQQGRTTPGKIVTQQQKPTFHWCKTGLAFDFCPVDDSGHCLWNRTDLFTKVGNIATDVGLSWGGNWIGFRDMPHIEWDCCNKYSPQMVRSLQLPPIWSAPTVGLHVGQLIKVANFATQWATNNTINPIVRGKQFYIRQIGDGKVLVAPAMTGSYTGWLRNQDVVV